MTEQYKCQSYYDDEADKILDCTCGRCTLTKRERAPRLYYAIFLAGLALFVMTLWMMRGEDQLPIIAIGDSITQQGWAQYADVDNRGISSATVADYLMWGDDLQDCLYSTCVVFLGINDLAHRSLDDLIDDYPKLIEATRANNTYYVLIPHFAGKRVSMNADVDLFNHWLSRQGVNTIKIEGGTTRWHNDGTHYYESGYKQMATEIIQQIGEGR